MAVSTALVDDGYRLTFDAAPIAIWREDFSGVVELCDELRARGVVDLRSQLEADKALLSEAVGRVIVCDVNQQAVQIAGAASRHDLIGHIPTQMLTEDAYAALREQIVAVWDRADRLKLDLAGADFNGSEACYELHWVAPTVASGTIDYSQVVVMILDVSDRKRAQQEAEEHIRRLATLVEVGRRITSSLETDVILQRIADVTTDVLGADRALLSLFDLAGHGDVRVVGSGFRGANEEAPALQVMVAGIAAWAAEHKEPTLSPNVAADSRTTGRARDVALQHPSIAAVVAPIVTDGRTIGMLTGSNGSGSAPFSDSDATVLAMLAEQAAVVIQNSRLYEEILTARDSLQAAVVELGETQAKLLQAQKLEAIGSLAAGVAHEINTPIQYVADNTRFLKEVMEAHAAVVAAADAALAAVQRGDDIEAAVAGLDAAKDETDFAFLADEAPVAIEQSLEGIDRVAEIVRAMKEFAHPGGSEKASVDVNRAIRTTVEVSRNEWKYVADLELDLEEGLPFVPGLAGPLNQSMLVIIVNAAQAMAEAKGAPADGKGRIVISTRSCTDAVEIRFSDTGPGVPPEVLPRIFDPFFTTKEVGTGSGQGLSIAWSVVVEQHGGELYYDDAGPGANFVMRLPLIDTEDAR